MFCTATNGPGITTDMQLLPRSDRVQILTFLHVSSFVHSQGWATHVEGDGTGNIELTLAPPTAHRGVCKAVMHATPLLVHSGVDVSSSACSSRPLSACTTHYRALSCQLSCPVPIAAGQHRALIRLQLSPLTKQAYPHLWSYPGRHVHSKPVAVRT